MATRDRKSDLILFAVMAVVMMAFGLVIPLFPTYVASLGGSGRDLGLTMAAFSVMQFLFSPIWGNLSDAVGRKPIMLVGLLGCALGLLFYGWCTQLWMFYAARAFSGAVASATFLTAMAYIGDTTSEQDRSSGMGMVNGAVYAGMMLGPSMSGWLAGISVTLPFYAGAALCGLLLIFVLALLPESLPTEKRTPAAGLGVLHGPGFGEMWRALHGPLGYLLSLSFLLNLGMHCFWSIFGMFALQRHGLGAGPVGTIMAFNGVGSAVVQLFLLGRLTRRWRERDLIRVSMVSSAAGFVAMLLATDFISLLVTSCLFMMANSLSQPLVTTLVSKKAGEGQGKAMGLNSSFTSLGQIIGPTWAGMTLDLYWFMPFLSGAVVMAFSWVTTLFGFSARRSGAVAH